MNLDIGLALTYPTKDEKFVPKLLILSLLLLSVVLIFPIFFVGPFMVGYVIEIVKNFQNGDRTLPELDGKYGDYFMQGLPLTLVGVAVYVVWALLVTIVRGVGSAVFEDSGAVAAMIVLITTVVDWIVRFVFTIMSFAVVAIYAREGTLNSILNFDNYKEIFSKNLVDMLVGAIIVYVAGFVLTIVGVIALCVGILPAMVYLNFIQGGIIGQLELGGTVKKGEVESKE